MADTLDILSLEEAYQAVNNPQQSGHAQELERWITGISRRIDVLCGPVVQREIADEKHDGGRPHVVLNWTYATSASSVVEYRNTTSTTLTAETNDTKPADGYLLDDVGDGVTFLRRRVSGSDHRFPTGRRNVVVTYTAGRAANTTSVDPLFKLAAGAILRRLWQRDQGAWATGGDPFEDPGTVGFFKAVDPMVREFLADELRVPAVA